MTSHISTKPRPTWDEYFLAIAATVATRADCTRRKVGCVIVRDNRIMATGYNGGVPGGASCLAGQCPRGRMSTEELPGFDQPGASSYDIGPGSCIAIHAEQNAIMYCSLEDRKGATIYCTDEPCPGCARMITGSGIKRIWTPKRQEGRLYFMKTNNLMLHETNPNADYKSHWPENRDD